MLPFTVTTPVPGSEGWPAISIAAAPATLIRLLVTETERVRSDSWAKMAMAGLGNG
jgi:hypothetical protein